MALVLGVDGGSTKTIAVVASLDGVVRGAGRAGGSNIHAPDGVDGAMDAVALAVEAALAAASVVPSDLAAGVFSMSGVDWPEDAAVVEAEVRRRGFGDRVIVVNDAFGGLRAGASGGWGVAVICGTGAAIAAHAPDGRRWHSGYWQTWGAEGSLDLGKKALRAVFRADLELTPPTALTGRILAHFGEQTAEAMLHRLTSRDAAPPDIGLLAKPLLDEAEAGDPVAREIVAEHGGDLARFALVAARRVGIAEMPFELVLGGGVLRHPGRVLPEALIATVRAAAPAARVVKLRREPVAGAVLLAIDSLGDQASRDATAVLDRTMPPATWFEI